MDVGMSQLLRQEQKLILTVQMQMSLKLLQMPLGDLADCVEKELDENPILEVDYDTSEEAVLKVEDYEDKKDAKDFSMLLEQVKYDYNSKDIFYSEKEEDDLDDPFNYISKTISLKDYLKEQLIDRNNSKKIRVICEYLIDCLNEDGFLTDNLNDIADELKLSFELVSKALNIIKDLQPYGIGAKDFKESLKIQLQKRNICDERIYEIIDHHLVLIGENKFKELAGILKTDIVTIQKYAEMIRSLEPKPARGFYTGEQTKYIMPEAYIKKIGNDYYIIMNDDILPKLNVNSYYVNIIKEDANIEAINYIREKVNSGLTLIRGIEQRKNTIYRILECILILQKEYFDKGESYLKPMCLRDIAQNLNMHESTVSRAIRDKYVSTPRGTVKIKDFFSGSINNMAEDVSTRIVKRELAKLVKEEDKRSPLSDQSICDTLNELNFNISRRTVAKYREELGIKNSGKRKIFSGNPF